MGGWMSAPRTGEDPPDHSAAHRSLDNEDGQPPDPVAPATSEGSDRYTDRDRTSYTDRERDSYRDAGSGTDIDSYASGSDPDSIPDVPVSPEDMIAVRMTYERAEARLAEAHEEAQALVRDAAEQASMLGWNATLVAEQLIAEAQREADEVTRQRAHRGARDQGGGRTPAQRRRPIRAGAEEGARLLRAHVDRRGRRQAGGVRVRADAASGGGRPAGGRPGGRGGAAHRRTAAAAEQAADKRAAEADEVLARARVEATGSRTRPSR